MARFVTTEHMFMPTSPADARSLERLLPRLTGETIEIGVHPGVSEDWRAAERAGVQQFAPQARAAGHQLITWNDL